MTSVARDAIRMAARAARRKSGGREARARRLAVLLAPVALVLAQCTAAPEPEPPPSEPEPEPQEETGIQRGVALSESFDSLEPYSVRMLDSLDFQEFFSEHPEYASDSAAVVDFYERRDMQFAWIVNDSLTASAEAFIARTGAAEGSSPGEAPVPELRTLHERLYDTASTGAGRIPVCEGCATDLELRLTSEFYRFADRNYGGYLNRELDDLGWFIPRARKDVSRLLDSLAVGERDLSSYEPVHPQYQLLKSRLDSFRALADEPWPELALPSGARTLEVGDSAEVVGEVRERLARLGDLEDAARDGRVDSTLARAVERFQRRHGLAVDGVIGPNTLAEMNVPPEERMRTMLVNMERLRWMPEERPENLLMVNIPEFRLHVYEEDEEVMAMDVVVGTHATRTAVFADTVSQVVFSPTWTVPASITREEILPQLEENPDYLEERNMEIIGGSEELPVIRQRPGPNNALGRVKFLFPNSYSIYMHDTPAQSLFGQAQRTFSHGCIRLARPRELAIYLLRDQPEWTPERIDRAMAGGDTTPVSLDDPVPVVIAYFTAWVDDEGVLYFRDDVYGHDERLASELFAESDVERVAPR